MRMLLGGGLLLAFSPIPHAGLPGAGTTGTTVRPAVTEDYMRSLCKVGSPVRMMAVPKIGHAFIGRDSADAAVD